MKAWVKFFRQSLPVEVDVGGIIHRAKVMGGGQESRRLMQFERVVFVICAYLDDCLTGIGEGVTQAVTTFFDKRRHRSLDLGDSVIQSRGSPAPGRNFRFSGSPRAKLTCWVRTGEGGDRRLGESIVHAGYRGVDT